MIPAPYLLYLGDAADELSVKTSRGLAVWRPELGIGEFRRPECAVTLGLPNLSFEEAASRGAKTLVLGVANAGGSLGPHLIEDALAALRAGLNLASGLHERLHHNREIKALADQAGLQLFDVREPPPQLPIGKGRRRPGPPNPSCGAEVMRNARRRTISPIGPHPKMENPVVTQSLANAAPRREASRVKLAYVGTAIALVLAAAGAGQAVAQPKAVDVIVRGGTVYTGAEQAPFVGDVAFDQDKIVYVGPASGDHFTAKRTIDAKGMIVAPGLIDAHTHPDFYIRSADPALRVNAPWLAQGVSTVFIGVDGYGTPDVKADQDKLEQDKIGTNVVSYVGFGAIRNRILQQDARAPSPAELDQMKALVAKGMCEGAIGFSTGLFYAPQSFAKTEEVIALAKEAAKRGGVYDTHQRDESNYTIGVLNSVKEVIRIGREAGMPVHIAHLKALGVDVQGQGQAIVDLINQARASGLDATADEYPWLASGSSLQASLVPGWAVDGGYPAMIKRFDDPATMEKIRVEMRENLRRRGGPDSMLLTAYDAPWSGKTLTAMAAEWKVEPIEAAVRILRQARNKGSIASFNMADRDVDLIMKQPWVVTSSDGSDGHPRQYATFPEKYAVYVKQRHVIDLANFIRHSTGLTADMFKLDRRGYLRPGYFADVVVFNPDTYAPKADYIHPRVLSAGVVELFVNGQAAVDDGKISGALPGRAIKHTPTAGSCS